MMLLKVHLINDAIKIPLINDASCIYPISVTVGG
jgi:hypothetical protein